MSRPVLYDLYCKAGGATRGYQEAGFYVVGVDIEPQPNYCGDEFILADALEVSLEGAAAIHASPPCQAYTVANNIHGAEHPELVEETRLRLQAAGVPWVIENVPGAPLRNPYLLCGRALGLGVKRHRLFETTFPLLVPSCPPGHPGDWVMVFGGTVLERSPVIGRTPKGGPIMRRKHLPTDVGREAMGISWMLRAELSEAIPPAYTALVGTFLREHLKAVA